MLVMNVIAEILKKEGVSTLFCFPTTPIIEAAADRLGLESKKVIINLERFGNTTAATIPLALTDAIAEGRLKKGDLVVLASVGAGFTVGAVLLRWSL